MEDMMEDLDAAGPQNELLERLIMNHLQNNNNINDGDDDDEGDGDGTLDGGVAKSGSSEESGSKKTRSTECDLVGPRRL